MLGAAGSVRDATADNARVFHCCVRGRGRFYGLPPQPPNAMRVVSAVPAEHELPDLDVIRVRVNGLDGDRGDVVASIAAAGAHR